MASISRWWRVEGASFAPSCPIKTLGQEVSVEGKTVTLASKRLRKLNHVPDRILSKRAALSSVMAMRRGRMSRS